MTKFVMEAEQANGKRIKRQFEALNTDEAVVIGEEYVEILQNLHGLFIIDHTVYNAKSGVVVL